MLSHPWNHRTRPGTGSQPAFWLLLIGMIFLQVPVCLADDPSPKATTKKDNPSTKREMDRTKVWKVQISIPAKEYQAMQPKSNWGFFGMGGQKPKPNEKTGQVVNEVHRNNFGMDLTWVKGSVTVDDQTFDQVGIRYKGNGTLGDATKTIKKSFKIELDHFGGKGKFLGMKNINLHCGVADPSKCREAFGYGIYRAMGIPAPQTALAEVTLSVPGKHEKEWLGLYVLVEQVDKPFLRDHFGSDKGLLLKPEGVREIEYLGDKWDRYKKQYAPKGEPTKEQSDRVIAFAHLIHKADDATFAREIESFLDINEYLRFLAATAFVSNSDCFFVLGHNYYLYLDPKKSQFHFFPWDLDRAFANLPFLGSVNQQMTLSFAHPYGGNHKLTDRLFAIPGIKEKYQDLLKKASASTLSKESLLKDLEVIEAASRDLLKRDSQASAKRKDVENGFGPQDFFGRPPALNKFVEKRTASLLEQVAGATKGFIPGGNFRISTNIAEQLVEGLDQDKDGKLSREEWDRILGLAFDACELDDQKRVNEKNLAIGLNKRFQKIHEGDQARPLPDYGMGQFMAGPIFRRINPDKDGKINRTEWMTHTAKAFADFDKDHDQRLTENELANLLEAIFPLPNFGGPPPKQGDPKENPKKDKN